MDLGQKKKQYFWLFFVQKISFIHYTHISHYFGLRQTRINWIESSLCPEVNMATFGFPVGARSAAQQPVFLSRLTKMALFEANITIIYPGN